MQFVGLLSNFGQNATLHANLNQNKLQYNIFVLRTKIFSLINVFLSSPRKPERGSQSPGP